MGLLVAKAFLESLQTYFYVTSLSNSISYFSGSVTYAYKSNLGKEGRIDFGLRGQLVVLGLSWRWEQGQLVLGVQSLRSRGR